MLRPTGRDYATIGEVVEDLKKDFPSLSISKIRYLEEEGLINPKRSSGGYRKFSEKDISRIRTILSLQKEKSLPLNVIKTQLKSVARGEYCVKTPQSIHLTSKSGEQSQKDLNKTEKPLKTTPIETQWSVGHRSIKAGESGQEAPLASIDLSIMKLVKKLERYGIEPRHIRLLENSIDRELSLYQQIFPPTLMQKREKSKKKSIEDFNIFISLTQDLKRLLSHKSIKTIYGTDILDDPIIETDSL